MATKAEVQEEVEFMQLDEETGELCIGDACFMVRIHPETNQVTLEMNEDAEVCSLQTRRLAKKVLQNVMADKGVKTKVRFQK